MNTCGMETKTQTNTAIVSEREKNDWLKMNHIKFDGGIP